MFSLSLSLSLSRIFRFSLTVISCIVVEIKKKLEFRIYRFAVVNLYWINILQNDSFLLSVRKENIK